MRYLAVAARLAIGDVAQRLPHAALKRRALGRERQREALQLAGEIGPELCKIGRQRLAVSPPAALIRQRAQAVHEVHVAQAVLVDGDQQLAAGGIQQIVTDHDVISSGCSLSGAPSSAGCSLMACHNQLAA
ncbi:hypothetical protein D3C80_1626880 [compost metagenome]